MRLFTRVVQPPRGGRGKVRILSGNEKRFVTTGRTGRLMLSLNMGVGGDPHYVLRLRAADGALKESHEIPLGTQVWWQQAIRFKTGDRLTLQRVTDDRLSRTIEWWLGQGWTQPG
jgi:hypothetical protein